MANDKLRNATSKGKAALQRGRQEDPSEALLVQRIKSKTFIDQIRDSHPGIMNLDGDKQVQAIDRFLALTRAEIKQNSALASTNPVSVLHCFLDAAKLGLEPGPMRYIYIVPFKGVATLIISARGWAKMAKDAGFRATSAGPIRENDTVSHNAGTNAHFTITWDCAKPRGEVVGYYAYTEDSDGFPHYEILDLDRIEKHRNASPSKNTPESPWNTWKEEMGTKTAAKVLFRKLPLTAEMQYATDADETIADKKDASERDHGRNIIDLDVEATPDNGPEDEVETPPLKGPVKELVDRIEGMGLLVDGGIAAFTAWLLDLKAIQDGGDITDFDEEAAKEYLADIDGVASSFAEWLENHSD